MLMQGDKVTSARTDQNPIVDFFNTLFAGELGTKEGAEHQDFSILVQTYSRKQMMRAYENDDALDERRLAGVKVLNNMLKMKEQLAEDWDTDGQPPSAPAEPKESL